MTQRLKTPVAALAYRPDETVGSFTGRFVDEFRDQPIERIARAAWVLAALAFSDGQERAASMSIQPDELVERMPQL